MPSGLKALLLLLLLTLPVWAQPPEQPPAQSPLSSTYVLKLGEDSPSITVLLPEGYGAVQQPDGDSAMFFAPWNEFFSLVIAGFHQSVPGPIDSEARMTAELDAFRKANAEVELVNQKQWSDPKGPRASFESFSGVKPKRIATCNLVLPGADRLVVLTTAGDESSLPDQRLIHQLILKEINAR